MQAPDLVGNLKTHVEYLAGEIGSRSLAEPSRLAAAAVYIRDRFGEMGYRIVGEPITAFGAETENILALPPGRSSSYSGCLLGAHYDTVHGSPGADDNASGVAVMLEVARTLAGQELDIMFAAFTAEEPPAFNTRFMGSRVFVRGHGKRGRTLKEALILEMVGFYSGVRGSQQIPLTLKWLGFSDTADFIAVVGNGPSRDLVERLRGSFEGTSGAIPVETLCVPGNGFLLPESRLSDNASFWDAGIPAVMITDTAFFRNPHYHGHRDRPETLDYLSMGRLVTMITRYLEDSRRQAGS